MDTANIPIPTELLALMAMQMGQVKRGCDAVAANSAKTAVKHTP
jgi:hypothetical protein